MNNMSWTSQSRLAELTEGTSWFWIETLDQQIKFSVFCIFQFIKLYWLIDCFYSNCSWFCSIVWNFYTYSLLVLALVEIRRMVGTKGHLGAITDLRPVSERQGIRCHGNENWLTHQWKNGLLANFSEKANVLRYFIFSWLSYVYIYVTGICLCIACI